MEEKESKKITPVKSEWGKEPEDHFGYASEEERRRRRGLEDWELVERMPESQRRIPKWFIAIILIVLLAAFGLTVPFWGDRPDQPRPWFTWGHVLAVVYFGIFAGFIYAMIRLFTTGRGEDKGER